MEPQSSKNFILYSLLAVVLSAAISGGIVYAVESKQNTDTKNTLQDQVDTLKSQITALPTPTPTPAANPAVPATPVPTASPVATATPAANLTTYTNATYGWSVKYPSSWSVADAASLGGQTKAVQDTSVVFTQGTTTRLTVNLTTVAKAGSQSIADFAGTYTNSAQGGSLSGGTAYTINTYSGYKELASFTAASGLTGGLVYFVGSPTNYYTFKTSETTESTDIANILASFTY